MSALIIDDIPVQVLPKLAVAIGLNEAIVTQQLHWLLKQPQNGRIHDGHKWIFNTYEQWREHYFPFWSACTISRIFDRLEELKVIISCQPEGRLSRRKHYRIDKGVQHLLFAGKIPEPSKVIASVPMPADCSVPMPADCSDGNASDCLVPLETKTTAKTSTNNTHEPAERNSAHDAGAPGECDPSDDFEAPRTNTNHDPSEANAKSSGGAPDLFSLSEPSATEDRPTIEAMKFATWFLTLLPDRFKKTVDAKTLKAWGEIYDKLKRLDGRTKQEIIAVTTWARASAFWATNFYSPAKLREKQSTTGFKYFDVFADQMENEKKKNKPVHQGVPIRPEDMPQPADMGEAALAAFRLKKAARLAAAAAQTTT